MPPVLAVVRRHPRLSVALALGIAAGVFAPDRIAPGEPFRPFLIGWIVAVWAYLALVAQLTLRANHQRVREFSEREDPGAAAVLTIVSLIAIASLIAIGAELANARDSPDRYTRYALAGLTLAGSWLMLNVEFALHYAHLYFRAPRKTRPLRFPDDPQPDPDFRDFLYFAFTIGAAAQTSDISVVSSALRRVVLAHTVLAFVFNVAILGVTINVAASLLNK